MKINLTDKIISGNFIYPFWDKDDNIKKALPDYLYEKITKDTQPFKNKFSTRRYFIDNKDITVIHLGRKNDINPEILRRMGYLAYLRSNKEFYENFNVFIYPDLWNIEPKTALNAFIEGFVISDYKFNGYKKEEKIFMINTVNITADAKITGFDSILKRILIIKESIDLVRDMVNEPANIADIDYMETASKKIAKTNNIKITVHNRKKLEKMGMNLILAVGQSAKIAPRLIELNYNTKPENPTICIIGKGIVFDTGGIQLKPVTGLDEMKTDMAGAATVLGVINAASRLKLPINLICLMPLAENTIDGLSYRPGDIITAYNKKSVEIKNTDAEGRLVLADALSYSDTKKCNAVVDIATLTGAAIVALGSGITAGFFHNDFIRDKIMRASYSSGEPVWELPLHEDYKEMLKNEIADLSNIGDPPRVAGTIIGALFLDEFIKNPNWAHLDIAGPSYLAKDFFYNKKGATGVMLRTLLVFLENFK